MNRGKGCHGFKPSRFKPIHRTRNAPVIRFGEVVVTVNAPVPPAVAAWEAADAPFRVVLGALQPNAVLVLGRRLWNQIQFQPPGMAFAHILHPASPHMRLADSISVLEGLLRRA